MLSILDRIKQRKNLDEDDLIRVHHTLMKEYGWIPFEEFKKLPTPTIINLLNCINEDRKREENEMKKAKRK